MKSMRSASEAANGKKPVRFSEEEMPVLISAQEGKRFLKALQNPPRPNQAALRRQNASRNAMTEWRVLREAKK
jgi:hypothetical protein